MTESMRSAEERSMPLIDDLLSPAAKEGVNWSSMAISVELKDRRQQSGQPSRYRVAVNHANVMTVTIATERGTARLFAQILTFLRCYRKSAVDRTSGHAGLAEMTVQLSKHVVDSQQPKFPGIFKKTERPCILVL